MLQSTKAQTNIDFALALLILIGFLTSTILLSGSPIFGIERSDINYEIDAQKQLVDLEYEHLQPSDGTTTREQLVSIRDSDDLSAYIDLPENTQGNLTIKPANRSNEEVSDERDYNHRKYLHGKMFDSNEDEWYVGDTVPNTVISSAATVIEVDTREIRIELRIWRQNQ